MSIKQEYPGQRYKTRSTRSTDGRRRGTQLASKGERIGRYEDKRLAAHKKLIAYHERQR